LWPPLALAALTLVVTGTFWAGEPKTGGLNKDQQKLIFESLRDVTNKGAKLFNEQGDVTGCYRLYEGAVLAVRPLLAGDPELQKAIDAGLAEAQAHPSLVQRAFIVRKVIDQIRDKFNPNPGAVTPPDGKDKDFKISAGGVVKIKQGEKKDVQVSVARGKDFADKIKVDLKSGKGLTVTPPSLMVNETDISFKVSITAAKDATPGKAEVFVSGSGGGKTVNAKIHVEVEKGAAPPPPPDDKTLKIIAPAASKLKAGEKKDVLLTFTRGNDLVGPIKVDIKAGKGLKVAPTKQDLAVGTSNLKVTITADKDAAGKSDVQVTATGDGISAKATIPIEIEKGANPPPPPDKKGDVSGKVTLDGKPLAAGQVTFHHKDFKFAQVFPAAVKDGAYSVAGLPPDTYVIVVGPPQAPPPGAPKIDIPAKYLDRKSSGLTVDVKAGANTFNLELKGDKTANPNPPPPTKLLFEPSAASPW